MIKRTNLWYIKGKLERIAVRGNTQKIRKRSKRSKRSKRNNQKKGQNIATVNFLTSKQKNKINIELTSE